MHRSLIAFSITLAVAHASGANTISTSASAGFAASPVTDADGPAISGQIFSEAIAPVDAIEVMTARSALDINGNSAVALTGLYIPSVNGLAFPQVTDAVTTWTSTLTNNEATAKPYVYSFLLNPILLLNYDNAIPNTNPLATVVSFAVEVRANGNLVFAAGAALRGAANGHVLTKSGTDLGGTFGSDEFSIHYAFAQHAERIPVGSVAPGASITVEAKLIAHTEAPMNGSGGTVTMGDPLDLKGDPGVSAVIFSVDDLVGVAPASWGAAKRLYR